MTTHFKLATTDEDFKAVGILYHEYFDFLVSLGFNVHAAPSYGDTADELTGRAKKFMPPKGCQILAFDNEQLAGCIALHELDDTICEVNRLYVRPSMRGKGIGKKLLQAVLKQAKHLGYKTARLDSNVKLKSAIQLYPVLGFKQISAYHDIPVEGMLYFEKEL